MKRFKKFIRLTVVFLLALSTLAGFEVQAEGETVVIQDAHGEVEVPKNPERVVSLDNRTFETLDSWDVPLVAAPKDIIPDTISYASDDSVENVGNHREPNLEVIAAVEPDLVIVGQRFASYYEDIKALVPDAAVIDLNVDLESGEGEPGDLLMDGLITPTQQLGEIFGHEEEAAKLVEDFEQSVTAAQEAYNGEDTIMAVNVSGGNIGYAAPGNGRVWGPLFDIFDWVPALEVEGATSDHQGDEISVEAIAESNPDWIMVLDRDAAAVKDEETVPAEEVIADSEALKSTTAIENDQLVYAPLDTYTNESIQTFTELFNTISETFKK